MIVSAVAVLGFPLVVVERLAVVTIMLVEDIYFKSDVASLYFMLGKNIQRDLFKAVNPYIRDSISM